MTPIMQKIGLSLIVLAGAGEWFAPPGALARMEPPITVEVQPAPAFGDDQITQAIEQRMQNELDVNSRNVHATVQGGYVTLTGIVSNVLAKERATAIAESTQGVQQVVNRILVAPPEESSRVIGETIHQALIDDPVTRGQDIGITVNYGVVRLYGTARTFDEMHLAVQHAKSTPGVNKVVNDIRVEQVGYRSDGEIRDEVRRVLDGSVMLDGRAIDVDVYAGTVKLSGTVSTPAEIGRAVQLAWVGNVDQVDASGLHVRVWTRDEMRRPTPFGDYSDIQLRTAARNVFLLDPRILSHQPHVIIENGVVTLTGTVGSLEARIAAEEDIAALPGVRQVINRLKVETLTVLSDDQIAANVRASLDADRRIDTSQIRVMVQDGEVTLNGRVNNDVDKHRASRVAAAQASVLAVINQLTVNMPDPSASDPTIRDAIMRRLTWDPALENQPFIVVVGNGHVTISGQVKTPLQYYAVVDDAFVSGVKTVATNIKVLTGERNLPTEFTRSPIADMIDGPRR